MNDWPVFVYLYNEEGRYGPPITVENEKHFDSIKPTILEHIGKRLEVRVTDAMDFMLMHSVGGTLVFPLPEDDFANKT